MAAARADADRDALHDQLEQLDQLRRDLTRARAEAAATTTRAVVEERRQV